METSELRPGWALDDWSWRLVSLFLLPAAPLLALIVRNNTDYGYWQSLRLMFTDICRTLIYGNYDKKENE